ncbi:hypothetical protein Pcinc_006721 [Petrolisthes cinctipes]|uniref:Uncharacterized protein n=1 Tax=Petrolisthes cinctipes TaxID=88211 RepID=A0AAE1GCF4_PETCI|nr:hypothetical protein Pcinc_006721 [Petrolisthes cinctipes]
MLELERGVGVGGRDGGGWQGNGEEGEKKKVKETRKVVGMCRDEEKELEGSGEKNKERTKMVYGSHKEWNDPGTRKGGRVKEKEVYKEAGKEEGSKFE